MAAPTTSLGNVTVRKLNSVIASLWTKIKNTFAPKDDGLATHDTTKFYRADGSWAVPSGDSYKIVYIDGTITSSGGSYSVSCNTTYAQVAAMVDVGKYPVCRFVLGIQTYYFAFHLGVPSGSYTRYTFGSTDVFQLAGGSPQSFMTCVSVDSDNTWTFHELSYNPTSWTNSLATKESKSNKKTDVTANKTSDTYYPTCKAVYDLNKVVVFEAPYSSGANTYPDGADVLAAITDGKHPIVRVYTGTGNGYDDYIFEDYADATAAAPMTYIYFRNGVKQLYVTNYSGSWSWSYSQDIPELDTNGKVPTSQLPSASTSASGIVQLTSSVTSGDTTHVPTADAVYTALVQNKFGSAYYRNVGANYYAVLAKLKKSAIASSTNNIAATFVVYQILGDASAPMSKYRLSVNIRNESGTFSAAAERYVEYQPSNAKLDVIVKKDSNNDLLIIAKSTGSTSWRRMICICEYVGILGVGVASTESVEFFNNDPSKTEPSGTLIPFSADYSSAISPKGSAVGSASQPVYVDAAGRIQPCFSLNLANSGAAMFIVANSDINIATAIVNQNACTLLFVRNNDNDNGITVTMDQQGTATTTIPRYKCRMFFRNLNSNRFYLTGLGDLM